MANIKQQKKRILTNNKSNLQNSSFKSSLKTAVKNVETNVAANNREEAINALSNAYKKLDKAVSKGILHKNSAARYKSRLHLLVNKVQ